MEMSLPSNLYLIPQSLQLLPAMFTPIPARTCWIPSYHPLSQVPPDSAKIVTSSPMARSLSGHGHPLKLATRQNSFFFACPLPLIHFLVCNFISCFFSLSLNSVARPYPYVPPQQICSKKEPGTNIFLQLPVPFVQGRGGLRIRNSRPARVTRHPVSRKVKSLGLEKELNSQEHLLFFQRTQAQIAAPVSDGSQLTPSISSSRGSDIILASTDINIYIHMTYLYT